MAGIPAASVDLVLCDLPYGVTDCAWDRRIDAERLWRAYSRVLKPRGAVVLFASCRFCLDLRGSAPAGWFRYSWCWDKRSVSGFLWARKRPMAAHEMVLVFAPGMPRYFPQGLVKRAWPKIRGGRTSEVYGQMSKMSVQRHTGWPTTMLRIARERNAAPAQKPVAVLEYLIRTYTRRGETVLDNAMGLGSTGVAAVRTGRRFVGMEIDEARFRVAARRIREAIEERSAR